MTKHISRLAAVALLAAVSAVPQDHKWAGRTLDNFEWSIHEQLASLPSYGIFDSIRFEVTGKTVTLSGHVVKESLKHNAERMVNRIEGVTRVNNQIEVLPASKSDDALRMNVYRAIYETQPFGKYGAVPAPPIHIIVKNGWVMLEGVVDSEAERADVRLRALKASSHVSDHLRVAPEEL